MSLLRCGALGAALMILTSCEPRIQDHENSEVSGNLATAPESEGAKADAASSPVTSEKVPFRWDSGMHMRTYWAAVGSKNDDWLRFFAEADLESNSPPNWTPSVEIADPAMKAKIAKGGLVNFVSGETVASFPYEVDQNGDVEVQLLGMHGASSLSRLLEMLQAGDGKPICVEFPKADYRTCFSTKGAKEALHG